MDGNERLKGLHVPERRHRPLSSLERLMRVFGPVVEPATADSSGSVTDHRHRREADNLRRAIETTKWVAHCRRLRKLARRLKPVYSDNGRSWARRRLSRACSGEPAGAGGGMKIGMGSHLTDAAKLSYGWGPALPPARTFQSGAEVERRCEAMRRKTGGRLLFLASWPARPCCSVPCCSVMVRKLARISGILC